MEKYQTMHDKDLGVINVRNLKMMLYNLYNLNNFEIEHLLAQFDDSQDGYCSIMHIQKEITKIQATQRS